MKYILQPYNMHELGQRENQEDSLFPSLDQQTQDDRLFILCDGMGGHEKGEVASSTVCEVMSKTILSRWNTDEPLSDELLQQALDEAYDALDAKDNGEARKMGTTMTLLCFHAQGVTVAHIGDSRVYQLRPANGKESARVVFRTQDHSLVNDLVRIGEITEEEAKTHPQKNVITRAMQPCQERRAKADVAHLTDVRPGDYFYMCSDGMLEQSTDDNLLYIITKSNASDEDKMEMLRNVTSENKDNHTAHLIHVVDVKDVLAVSGERKESEPVGALVMPDGFVQDKKSRFGKKRRYLYLLTGLLLLFIVAVGCYFFFCSGVVKGEDKQSDRATVVTQKPVKHPGKDAKKQNDTVLSVRKDSLRTAKDSTKTNERKLQDNKADSSKHKIIKPFINNINKSK